MSAEDSIRVVLMGDGQFVLAVVRGYDTCEEMYGEVRRIVALVGSYEEACETMARVTNPNHKDYVYTEFGGEMPELEELKEDWVRQYTPARLFVREADCAE